MRPAAHLVPLCIGASYLSGFSFPKLTTKHRFLCMCGYWMRLHGFELTCTAVFYHTQQCTPHVALNVVHGWMGQWVYGWMNESFGVHACVCKDTSMHTICGGSFGPTMPWGNGLMLPWGWWSASVLCLLGECFAQSQWTGHILQCFIVTLYVCMFWL